MFRKSLIAGGVLALVLVGTAFAQPSMREKSIHKFGHATVVRYERLHRLSTKKCGAASIGRQIIRYGMPKAGPDRLATKTEVASSIGVMERCVHPPVQQVANGPQHASVSSTTGSVPRPGVSQTASSSSGGCGGVTPYSGGGQCWAIPYNIVQCESGGSYNAHNPSGASGAYQLMVGGGGSKAQQDQNAARLWNGGAGRSNWVC